MKLSKKLVLASLCASMTMGLAFGQTSKTSESTSGLFSTDIDNFMSVTGWSSVKASNAFIMADADGFGFAKQFKPFYMGLYLGGVFDALTSTSTKTETSSDTAKSNSSTYTFNDYTLKALFGFGNMAVSAYFSPNSGTSTSSSSSSSTTETKNVNKDFNISTGLSFGMNTNLLGKAFDQTFSFDINPVTDYDYSYSKISSGATAGTVTTENADSEYNILLTSDSSWELYSGKGLTNTAGLIAGTEFSIIPDKKDSTTTSTNISKGAYEYDIGFIPNWTTKYEVEGFKLGVKGSLGLMFNGNGEANTVTTGDTTVYTATRILKGSFVIYPMIEAGAQVKIAKPVTFNVGTSLDLPTLSWQTTKTLTRETDSGNVTQTVKSTTFAFNGNGADTSISFNSGFSVDVAKNVLVDFSYNILSQFDNFAWTPAGTDIWGTLNNLIFTSLEFGVSIRL